MSSFIGERILTLRKAYKLTQSELAKQAGISQQHVSHIENGTKEPSEQLIKHLCVLYDTSEEWILKGDGEMILPLEKIIKSKIEQRGERAFYEAVMSIADERALAILTPRLGRNNDPELERMLNIIIELWSVEDEALKSWAKIQFAHAFPLDIIEDVQKKRANDHGQVSAG